MSQIFWTEATIGKDGELHLTGLPFSEGERVKIQISEITHIESSENLRGSVLRYDGPFDPATREEDWLS